MSTIFIRHFHISNSTLCLPLKILHYHCFQFLLGLAIAPREIENSAYAQFWGTNRVYYGRGESGELKEQTSTLALTFALSSVSRFFCLNHEGNSSLEEIVNIFLVVDVSISSKAKRTEYERLDN